MSALIIWVVIWWIVWISWNLIRKFLEQLQSKKYIYWGLFFLPFSILIYLYYQQYLHSYLYQLLIATVSVNFLGMFLGTDKVFYTSIRKDRFFLLFQTFCILFQQIMVVSGILLLKLYFGDEYQDYYFGIWFFVMHSPIVFAKWAKLRYLYLTLSLLGGIAFSYLINNVKYGLILSFLLHYLLYVWTIYYLKDERKI